jgi:hypothetical protein
MDALRKATIAATESDPVEFPSSLLDENKEGVAATPSATFHDSPTEGLPTIQSETENLEELLVSRPGITKAISESKALSDDSHSTRTDPRPHSQPVSRRGSSNSVRAIFGPFLFDSGTRLARPTPVYRHHTDQGLSDVFSDLCRDARNLAELQNQELFQLPRPILRSKSGMAVSGLRGRRDSRIFNRRSYCGPPVTSLPLSSTNSIPNTIEKAKHKKERPSTIMVFTQSGLGEDPNPTPASALQTRSPTILSLGEDQTQTVPAEATTSLGSTGVTSSIGSTLSSPAGLNLSAFSSPCIQPDATKASFENSPEPDKGRRPKRSRSMADNVRSFFSSPSKRLTRCPSVGADLLVNSLSWTKGTRTPPSSYPRDRSEHSLPSVAVHPVHVDADTPTTGRSFWPPGRNSTGDLRRKRSLFAYGRRNATDVSRLSAISTVSATSSATETSGSNSPARRRSVKDILLHFRNN